MQVNEFRYGDTESNVFGITCDRENHYLLPPLATYTQDIPGMDGTVDFGIGGYGVRTISYDIYYDGDYETLRSNREKIIVWLCSSTGSYKQLEFGDESGKYYMAKVTAALDFKNSSDHKLGTLQFTCNPPWQYQNGVLLTPDQIAWNTQDSIEGVQWMKTFTASGSIRFTNTGTLAVNPVIKLIGNIPSGLQLTYGTAQWKYNAAIQYDGIMIDCAAQTVTRMSDGANLFSNVDAIKYAYFNIASGQAEISVSASGLGAWPSSLDLLIEFSPQNAG